MTFSRGVIAVLLSLGLVSTPAFGDAVSDWLMKIEMAQQIDNENKKGLYELRTRLISEIDPLNAKGTDLHDFILQRIHSVIHHQ